MATKPRARMASRKQLQSLKDNFKDVGFQEYPQLNEECKRHFIGCLDGRSLARLGMCSKAEQRLTAGIPLKIYGIKLSHGRYHISGGLWKTEKVQTKLDGGDKCCVHFKQVGTSVLMKTEKGHLLDTHENAENFKEAVAFFEDLLNKCNYGVEEIILNMGAEMREWAERDGSGIGNFPNVRIVGLYEMDSIHQKYWLQKVPEHLERLHLNEAMSEIAELPHFRNVRHLICGGRCDVTNAQLLELNAVDVILDHAPLITPEGINVFLKRWQCGGGVDGFRKLKIERIGSRLQVEDVIKGLDALKVEEKKSSDSFFVLLNKVRPFEYLKFWINSEGIDAQVVMEAPSRSRIASRIELLYLKDHFKGLGFPEYPLLNDDCKRNLMKCLERRSLGRIGMCSKAEQRLAAEIPLKISEIKMWNGINGINGGVWPNTKMRLTFERGDQCCVVFQQFGERVWMDTKKGRNLWRRSNSEHFKEAEAFLENLLKKCRYGEVELVFEMKPETGRWAERYDSEMGRLRNVRTAKLWGMNLKYWKFWLKKMPDYLELLLISNDVTSEDVECTQFRTARQLDCRHNCYVTDAHLLELNAIDIYFWHAPLITAHGLNVFFKRWQCGGGVDGFRRLAIRHIGDGQHTVRLADVIDGLDARNVEEDGDSLMCLSIPNNVHPDKSLVLRYHHDYLIKAEVM